jgi:tRNA-dihydrouridine synthase B
MHIGSLEPCNAVFLAPMAGVTDLPMRELAIELGAGLAVGEMQTADTRLAHTRKSRLRQQHSKRAGIRAVQIVGWDPQQLAEAAQFNARLGAEIIDINMGCPAKKVCRRAAGSALLADEALVGRILDRVVKALDIPVTLKIRTGTDHEHRNGSTIARIAEDAGVQMLVVHGRTRADRFKGEAEYDTIAEIVESVSIPVLANGDIDSAAKARSVLSKTGASGVMIGRAAQGRLWLPGAIASALATPKADATTPSIAHQACIHRRHISRLHGFHGEHFGVRVTRKHQAWFLDALVSQGALHTDTAREWRRCFNAIDNTQQQLEQMHTYEHFLQQQTGRLAA